MVVALTTLIALAVDCPKLTIAPVKKLVPVMVTAVPPELGPVAGEIEVTVAPLPVAAVPVVVNVHTGPATERFAMVLDTIFQ